MPVIEGASSITISGDARLYEIHGNAVINHLTDSSEAKNIQSMVNLPRAQASHKDYETSKKSGPCFPGTREALLREMMDWATKEGESRLYVLSGLAGIGKSTVVYTFATQADEHGLLGASFFFSRDEDDRNNAKQIFTTIAYQLCVYNETFAKVIGDALKTERGFAAATQNPQEQLKILILEPLRRIVQLRSRPILIVVDALDECDEEDAFLVLTGLSQLVRDLPSFKVILTTRALDLVLGSQGDHQIFHLQDIEDIIVDTDIRRYLQHNLSLEVQRHYPRRQWSASDEEIESLVYAVGRLFIIASTAVRYILDKSASNPAAQMQKLLLASAQDHTPFKDLDHFYNVILRNVVPENCDNYVVTRYQSVVGAIIFIQRPLPISTLAHLINIDVVDIREVLDNLQAVILLGSDDVPRIYHNSFADYLMDETRCKEPFRIDTRIHQTQIAAHCFKIMDKHLKRNILCLGDPARFMSNEDGLKEDGITDEQLQEKIPQQLRYACVYWITHLKVANIEDGTLMNGLDKFAVEHMLYWFEVLSLIGKLDWAHYAIRVVLKLLKLTSSDLYQLLSDALRFISKSYKLIEQSALHTYYSALPFTPTDSLLYRRYIKEAEHNLCSIEGGLENWDALVANVRHEEPDQVIKFSLDSSSFVSCSESRNCIQGMLKIWDAATGTPISTVPGDNFAVANDFSTVASSQDNITTLYNANGNPSTMFTTSSKIERLALSSESSRVAAALSDGTVWLWDSENAKLINSFDGFQSDVGGYWTRFEFSPTGTRLAYSSVNCIKLREGINGRFIADLPCGSHHKLEFSGDGSRIASLSHDGGLTLPGRIKEREGISRRTTADLPCESYQKVEFSGGRTRISFLSDDCGWTLWDSESGGLIATIRDVGPTGLAISANGSLLATADYDDGKVKLWSENNGSLAQIKVLEARPPMAFSLDNILAIATDFGINLYDVNTHSLIRTLPLGGMPGALAFSPDCTRLAVGGHDGNVNLWDVRGTDASGPPSKEKKSAITALALSRDCLRLACGFEDGTVELWGTSPTKRRIGPLALHSKIKAIFLRTFRQSRHPESVRALEFDPDGRLFASGSGDGTIKLWNGGDGALRGTIKASRLQAFALSNSVLVATWQGGEVLSFEEGGLEPISHERYDGGVTLWSLDTLIPIHTFDDGASMVSITENSNIIAIFRYPHVSLLDVVNRTTIATFDVPFDIHTMTFLPDNSQLVVQGDEGVFLSLNLSNKRITKEHTLEHLVQLPNTPLWHGVPIWHCQDEGQHYFSALFSQHKSPVPVLWIPREISVTASTQGSSMIALGCRDGRVIFIRLPTSHVG